MDKKEQIAKQYAQKIMQAEADLRELIFDNARRQQEAIDRIKLLEQECEAEMKKLGT